MTGSRRQFLQRAALVGAAGATLPLGVAASLAVADGISSNGSLFPGPDACRVGDQQKAKTPRFTPLRAPSYPLAVKSPYLSTWLPASSLAGTWPTFWNGHITAMTGLARIDSTVYLFMGNPMLPKQPPFPTMRQTSATFTSTSSVFVLEQAGVELTATFLSPIEPGDLKRQSRPLSYVTVSARSVDDDSHKVQVYLDISGEWACDDTRQQITWSKSGSDPITLSCQLASPTPLEESGQLARWGSITWSADRDQGLSWQIAEDTIARGGFVGRGSLTDTVDPAQPRAINDASPVFAFAKDLGSVDRSGAAPLVVSVGHVRTPAVSYLGTPLPPLWATYWSSSAAMIADFHADHAQAVRRASTLDARISRQATRLGGDQYAAICALALRQAYGATELVSRNGSPWVFLKEISSDGNVSSVDVIYPSIPVFAALDPHYLGMLLAPVLDYAENGGWPKQFAEHDLGARYPNATGHNDGHEEDMPVEESANMLIMAAAYAGRVDKRTAASFVKAHYTILKQWADYLVGNALDPGYQNQTDDFTGFIAHSVNLALKGIVGIGAMGIVATLAGRSTDASSYATTAKNYIGRWQAKAMDSSGTHLKLAYDQDGTWSLKYNGFADRMLGLGLIPDSVRKMEAAWYARRADTYGIPLDIRHTYTKADWEMFTAAWLLDQQDLPGILIESLYEFAATTHSRVPITDWYDAVLNQQSADFQARPVVGGFFALMALPSQ